MTQSSKMVWYRCQLIDEKYQIDLDVLLDETGVSDPTITYHGVWRNIDSRGAEVYPMVVAYDGMVDYGDFTSGVDRYHEMLVHGRNLSVGEVISYIDKSDKVEHQFQVKQLDPISERLSR